MFICVRLAAGILLPLVLGGLTGVSSPAGRRDTESSLLSRIERERNLVKKAKLEIRLGRLKLLQALAARDQGDVEGCYRLLEAYLERMKSAWATLKSSGRQAARRPEGFKELDIALREGGRLLEDLAHRVSYQERGPVEKVAKEIEQIRNEVLRALFPSEHSHSAECGVLRCQGRNSAIGTVQG